MASMDMSLSMLRELGMELACCSPWGLKESDKTEQLNKKGPQSFLLIPFIWVIFLFLL